MMSGVRGAAAALLLSLACVALAAAAAAAPTAFGASSVLQYHRDAAKDGFYVDAILKGRLLHPRSVILRSDVHVRASVRVNTRPERAHHAAARSVAAAWDKHGAHASEGLVVRLQA